MHQIPMPPMAIADVSSKYLGESWSVLESDEGPFALNCIPIIEAGSGSSSMKEL
jgi:hypothetical protein